jgi:energy-coupling factor transport system permease protein
MDPRTRLVLLLCVSVLAVCLDRPASLGLLCLLCAWPLLVLRLPGQWWRRGSLAVAAVVWGTVLSQGIFYDALPRVPLVELGPITIWKEGVFWGAVQSLRFVATILAGLAVAVSTSPDRLQAALMRLRVPMALAFLSTTALRTVPQTGRTILAVRQARASRGRPLWRRGPFAWLRQELLMLRPIVAESLRRARSLAEALDSRGFDPETPRSATRPLRIARWEWPILAAAVVTTAGVLCVRILFVLYTVELLYLPSLRPLYGFVRRWL